MDQIPSSTNLGNQILNESVSLKTEYDLVEVEQDHVDDVRVSEDFVQQSSSGNITENVTNDPQINQTFILSCDSESVANVNFCHKSKSNRVQAQMSEPLTGSAELFTKNIEQQEQQKERRQTKQSISSLTFEPSNSNQKLCNFHRKKMGPNPKKSLKKVASVKKVVKVPAKKTKSQLNGNDIWGKVIQEKDEIISNHVKQLKELRQDLEQRDKNMEKLEKQIHDLQDNTEKSKLKFENALLKHKLLERDLEDMKAKLASRRSEATASTATDFNDCGIIDLTEETCEANEADHSANTSLPFPQGHAAVPMIPIPDITENIIEITEQVPLDLSNKRTAEVTGFDEPEMLGSYLVNSTLRNENNFKCKHCDKLFLRKGSLTIHLRKHSGSPKFQCAFCKILFHEQRRLALHLALLHCGDKNETKKKRKGRSLTSKKSVGDNGPQSFSCCFCHHAFGFKKTLQQHIDQHHGKLLRKVN